MAPVGGAFDLKIKTCAAGTAVDSGRPVTVNGVIGGAARNARRENSGHQDCRCQPHREFTHGDHLSTCEDVREKDLFHGFGLKWSLTGDLPVAQEVAKQQIPRAASKDDTGGRLAPQRPAIQRTVD